MWCSHGPHTKCFAPRWWRSDEQASGKQQRRVSMRLADLATLIRSKNAGPFFLTFDIMFSDEEPYRLVTESRLPSEQAVAGVYKCPTNSLRVFECRSAVAIKFSIRRP